ncbi:hypothetical protein SISSUDRAFT_94772 [Sistotremastrum suecicum HHB10207 ss-3]|uniref:DUF6535 domain-containing protein n=1 Tax=Sistotremastrum suecicum HHB10207 ss-3 TaxID=1314776 RepID=A0A166B6U7_9AGAM|nr:hypothetical protein SISSUDRAFT_94772 [Sistotremastrum suecicum HHB10207 ss-3]
MADPEPPPLPSQAPTIMNTLGDLAPVFTRMLSLMEDQNKMMADQRKTQTEQSQLLRDHSKMLEALEKDATRDDKAYEGRGLTDESTWGALDKEALAKMKVLVDGWKDLMNVSLIFIALFLTVVTAFISPIIQLFSTPSSTKSKPSLPPTSLQLVALFYYLALMFSICNSVMCVLGLQWASKLLSVPLGKTNLERALNRERRKVLAEQRLLPLMGVLFWTLLLSIAFFVIGFLIQFWALSFSFEERAPILIIGAVSATALAITILGVILATTYHATVHKNSPFESPLSSASVATLAWLKRVTGQSEKKTKKKSDERRRWYQQGFMIKPLNSFRHCIQGFPRWVAAKLNLSLGSPSHKSSGDKERHQDNPEPETEEEKPIEVLMKETADDNETVQALKAYARLVVNTNDAEVLERAVPSFETGEWCISGGDLLPVFLAVRERFLATDTSFRVKETVNKRTVDCREWSGWTDEYGRWREHLEGTEIPRWCRNECFDLVDRSHESHRQFFPSLVFFASLDPHNADLRRRRLESYEESVARVLSSFDQDEELGYRFDVFLSAVIECTSLLSDGRSDDVTRILSSGDRPSLLRSLLRNPWYVWDGIKDIVALNTRGNEVAVLEEMAEFFSNLPDMDLVHGDLLVIHFLESLIPSLPPTFTVPQSFDLIPTLTLFLRVQSRIEYSLPRYTDPLLYFLDHGGLKQLSSLRPAHDFFRLCLTQSSNDQLDTVSDRARFYLSEHHEAFTPLPGPSDQDLEDLVDALVSYKKNTSSQELQGNFIDAVMGCDCLLREQKKDEVTDILLRVGHLPILEAFIRNPRLRLKHISALVLLIIEGGEYTYLRYLSPAITDPSLLDLPGAYNPILEFLALLLRHLPSAFTVPREFDLSQTFSLFMRNRPDKDTWRKFSDALIQYLDHGALGALSDQIYVRRFLKLCVNPYDPEFLFWEPNERTSESTRQRAAELMKKLDAAQQSSGGDRAAGDVNPPEPINTDIAEPRRSLVIRVWHTFASRLKDPVPWKRNKKKHDDVGDVEMAMRVPSGV